MRLCVNLFRFVSFWKVRTSVCLYLINKKEMIIK